MTQWHPADPEHLFIHNDRRDGQFVSVIRRIDGSEVRIYDKPIYAIAPDGRSSLSLNFARLATHRPGYGYAGVADPWENKLYPSDDGIYLLNMETGDSELIISLDQLANNNHKPEMEGVHHWINHIQISRNG